MLKKGIKLFLKQNLFLCVAVVFFFVYYASAFRLPEKAVVFPKIMLFVAVPVVLWNFAAGILDVINELSKKPQKPQETEVAVQGKSKEPDSVKLGHFAALAMTLVYIFLIPLLGFFVTTTLYMIGVLCFFGIKNPLNILIYVIGMNVFIYFTFVRWVGIYFPKGILI